MKTSSIFKEVMRDYGKTRMENENTVAKRKNLIYETIPRIVEIDKELMSLGFQLTKSLINSTISSNNSDELIKDLQNKNLLLQNEKLKLLSENDFDENFLDKIYVCKKCLDTGFVKTERCSCLKQKLIDKYYERSNISNTLLTENFDTFDLKYYDEEIDELSGLSPKNHMKKLYSNCLDFVSNFSTKYENLLIYGETGLGKTFLCNCIAKELLNNGVNVVYVSSSQLFKLVEKLRFNRDEIDNPEEYYNTILESDLLIIDDLGTEFSTSVTVTELFNIINTRFLDKKSIIISTNLAPSDLKGLYTERVTSRIIGNYTFMKLVGKDIRIKKLYER